MEKNIADQILNTIAEEKKRLYQTITKNIEKVIDETIQNAFVEKSNDNIDS